MTSYIPQLTLPSSIFNSAPASILLPIALGTAVGYGTNRSSDQKRKYQILNQPPLHPPPSVFGPVWTLLYGMMGYASYRAYRIGTSSPSLLLNNPSIVPTTYHTSTLYTIQLGLNLIWMPLFFGIRRPIEATIDCAALVGINAYLAYTWGTQVDKVAGWLMVPYVAWLSFATYLSAGSGYLNDWDFSEERIRMEERRKRAQGKDL
ncbi:TspO/MBR family-domain-containing protein [Copromyces sp. CBS 386.78]|nr:TspO/MBR family-domain-containing protein [Copromyces sp. CBS 386.78]